MKTKIKTIIAVLVCFLFAYISYFVPYYELVNTPSVINLTESDVINLTNNKFFGKFINPELKVDSSVNAENDKAIDIIFKIFNLFPIKKIKANIYEDKQVYLGGELFGFSLQPEGAIIDGINSVASSFGNTSPALEAGIKVNDVLVSVNGVKVENSKMLNEFINRKENCNSELTLNLLRDGKSFSTKIMPVYDVELRTYRLGAWLKDEISGIGTLTYCKDNLEFGGLGHGVTDAYGKIVEISGGEVYDCNFLGIKKGQKGVPGEIRGLLVSNGETQGEVQKNNAVGLYGKLKDSSKLYSKSKSINIGGRFSAKPGNAKIICDVDGHGTQEYNIEIIKATSQSVSTEKSMVIRVTDKKLLSLTGGIVQGMSGSPIIQGNKLVGALTHVFVNDPTKGYGIYLDWMLEN